MTRIDVLSLRERRARPRRSRPRSTRRRARRSRPRSPVMRCCAAPFESGATGPLRHAATTAKSAAIRNDDRNPRVNVSRIAATTPSRVSRSFSSVAAPRLSNGTVGSGTSPRGASAIEVAQVERQRHLRAQRDRRIEHLGRRRLRRDERRACSGCVDSTGAMTASASTNPACRAAMLIVAARVPGASGGTAAGASTPPSSPRPRPHAASAAAAHTAVDAGRNPSATSPPASAMPPTADRDALRQAGDQPAHDDRRRPATS